MVDFVERENRVFYVVGPLRALDFIERAVELGQLVHIHLDQLRFLSVRLRVPLDQQLQRFNSVELRLGPVPLQRAHLELVVVQSRLSLGVEDRVQDGALVPDPLLGLAVLAAVLLDAEAADQVLSSKDRLLVRDMVPSICWLTESLVRTTEPMVLRMSRMWRSSW